jgi:hypothetical protein
VTISFFNILDTEKELSSGLQVQSLDFCFIFNELAKERKTMLKDFVSFFNKISTEKRNYARDLCFIF